MIHLILLLAFILIFGVGVFTASLQYGLYKNPEFLGNLLTELHGVFVESILVMVILGGVTNRMQNLQTKQGLLKELDAARGIRGPEIRNCVLTIIESLLKLGEKDINMANLDLSWGIHAVTKKILFLKKYKHINVEGRHFRKSCFNGATLSGHIGRERNNYSNCDFSWCDFSNSYLIDCDFSESSFLASKFDKARIIRCDFSKAKGITPKMLLKTETLYGSKFYEELEQEILELKPSLLNDKPLSDEEREKRKWKKLEDKGLIPKGLI